MSIRDLAHLAGVEQADVYKAGRLAGHLYRDHDDVVFAYVDTYVNDDSAHAVAVSLPKTAEAVRAPAGAVPPFFAGLLPEGARLQALTAAARTSTDDHLTLLLAVGADTIGDVQVVPAGAALAEPVAMFDPTSTGTADFTAIFATATSIDQGQFDHVGLAGVQVKVSAGIMSTPLDTTAGPAILKLEPPQYTRLVANEQFFLTMAAGCGLPVPRHRIVVDRNGKQALLVDRFDREIVPGAPMRRLAQEDACQVLGRYPAAKYRLSFQEVSKALAEAVAAGNGSRPLALRRIFEVAAFSYLIGNGDLHGKNLSIRETSAGIWEITPAYDLVSTKPYVGWDEPMALPMYGRANRLDRRWWLAAAVRLGLPERAITRVLDGMIAASKPWLDRLDEIGFDEPSTQRLRALIAERRTELAE